MKTGLYSRLALNGIKKNRRLYIPYLLTCSGMIMMFYIISFLSNSEILGGMFGGTVMQLCLRLGCIVMGVFSLIFLFYTNSFLIRRRKKEFGLYNILGMGKWNLARVLIWESVFVSLLSLFSGLFCGILFSKAAELLMVNILKMQTDFSLRISMNAVLWTVCLFAAVFLLILLNTLKQIRVSNPIELLHSESSGEQPPKSNWIIALAGVIILGFAYFIAVSIEDPINALIWFMIAVVMVILATYLLFIAGSVAFCKILQKKKNYYYKTNHFISVSSMVFRMKRNGAGLASICILCTMVLVMVSSTVCLYMGAEDSLRKRYPRNIGIQMTVNEFADFNAQQIKDIKASAVQAAKEQGEQPENILDYNMARFLAGKKDNRLETSNLTTLSNSYDVYIVDIDDYNRIMNKNETLEQCEALIYMTQNSKFEGNTIEIEAAGTLKIKKKAEGFVGNRTSAMNMTGSIFLFVPDMEETVSPMMQLADFKGDRFVTLGSYYGYDLSCDDEKQTNIFNSYCDKMQGAANKYAFGMTYSECAAVEKIEFYGLYGSLFFLGILLGIVFVFAAVLIIYYKQVSEGYEDQSRFDIMQKVGMNKKEIRKSINSQVLTVFFLPLLMSALHLGFAFPMIYKILMLFSITDLPFLILVTASCFAVFALCYIFVYKFTSRAYYAIVSDAKE